MTRQCCYLGANRALTQLSTGQPFFVNTDDRGISTWIILGGVWETFVDDVLCRLARPGMNFLDVGANMGYYSVKVGGLIGPIGKIFAFEPNPELLPFLQDNMEINGFAPRAQVFNVAAGDAEGSGELRFDYGNMGGGSLFGGRAGHSAVAVKVSTLDHCIPAGTSIDLAKIDAEGSELRILAGAKRLLAENPDMLIVLEANVASWRTYADPSHALGSLVEEKRNLYRIAISGAVEPMQSVGEFLHALESSAYCLICPKAFPARQILSGLVHEPAGQDCGSQLVAGLPAAHRDGKQPPAVPNAGATIRRHTRDLILNYVPGGEALLRLRRSLMTRSRPPSGRAI